MKLHTMKLASFTSYTSPYSYGKKSTILFEQVEHSCTAISMLELSCIVSCTMKELTTVISDQHSTNDNAPVTHREQWIEHVLCLLPHAETLRWLRRKADESSLIWKALVEWMHLLIDYIYSVSPRIPSNINAAQY